MRTVTTFEFLRRETPKKFYGITQLPSTKEEQVQIAKGLHGIDFVGMVFSFYASPFTFTQAISYVSESEEGYIQLFIPAQQSPAYIYYPATGILKMP